jgi:hypothetical protein
VLVGSWVAVPFEGNLRTLLEAGSAAIPIGVAYVAGVVAIGLIGHAAIRGRRAFAPLLLALAVLPAAVGLVTAAASVQSSGGASPELAGAMAGVAARAGVARASLGLAASTWSLMLLAWTALLAHRGALARAGVGAPRGSGPVSRVVGVVFGLAAAALIPAISILGDRDARGESVLVVLVLAIVTLGVAAWDADRVAWLPNEDERRHAWTRAALVPISASLAVLCAAGGLHFWADLPLGSDRIERSEVVHDEWFYAAVAAAFLVVGLVPLWPSRKLYLSAGRRALLLQVALPVTVVGAALAALNAQLLSAVDGSAAGTGLPVAVVGKDVTVRIASPGQLLFVPEVDLVNMSARPIEARLMETTLTLGDNPVGPSMVDVVADPAPPGGVLHASAPFAFTLEDVDPAFAGGTPIESYKISGKVSVGGSTWRGDVPFTLSGTLTPEERKALFGRRPRF